MYKISLMILSSLLLLSFHPLTGQKIQGKITYQVKATPRLNPLICDGSLYLMGDSSIFISNIGKYPGKFVDSEAGSDGIYLDKYGKQTLKNFVSETVKMRDLVWGEQYISEEKLFRFDWSISNEVKKIGKFKCNKATTSFRGRIYTAWFAQDIPISDGPWKFHGLPGLILAIYDDSRAYEFTAKDVAIPYRPGEKENINFTKKGIITDIETFQRAYYIEFEANAAASRAESDMDFEVTMNPYHPIELEFEKN